MVFPLFTVNAYTEAQLHSVLTSLLVHNPNSSTASACRTAVLSGVLTAFLLTTLLGAAAEIAGGALSRKLGRANSGREL